MNKVIAWKNGLFQFDGANIQSIMCQIARWYDVEKEYVERFQRGDLKEKYSRDNQLSDVLKILELSNVKFCSR